MSNYQCYVYFINFVSTVIASVLTELMGNELITHGRVFITLFRKSGLLPNNITMTLFTWTFHIGEFAFDV